MNNYYENVGHCGPKKLGWWTPRRKNVRNVKICPMENDICPISWCLTLPHPNSPIIDGKYSDPMLYYHCLLVLVFWGPDATKSRTITSCHCYRSRYLASSYVKHDRDLNDFFLLHADQGWHGIYFDNFGPQKIKRTGNHAAKLYLSS